MAHRQTPTEAQREAIEAEVGSLLVLAGPGSGKTFCLIERIQYLIRAKGFDPARICAFTFTNKAAGEISERLDQLPGSAGEKIRRSTIHAFCSSLLREHPELVGLRPGFGIADDAYQLAILARLGVAPIYRARTLRSISANKLNGKPYGHPNDERVARKYEAFLSDRNLVDFQDLILKATQLCNTAVGGDIRSKWDVILVDEFQDLSAAQYELIRQLSREHNHVFAVGDEEQLIYSFTGADPEVFSTFLNRFKITRQIHLDKNHRCPREVFESARKLITRNESRVKDRVMTATDSSGVPVVARVFDNSEAELAWIIEDLLADRTASGKDWGEFAVIYWRNVLGEDVEAAFVTAGVPCRLAQSRALADDPTICYLLAAFKVIMSPDDPILREAFFAEVLPGPLFDSVRASAEADSTTITDKLLNATAELPTEHPDAIRIRRAFSVHKNLKATGKRHSSLKPLVHELLSQRVGHSPTILENNADEITDPAGFPDIVDLARTLRTCRDKSTPVWIPHMGGREIPLSGMLSALGFIDIRLGGDIPKNALELQPEAYDVLGLPLSLFKAAQILEMEGFAASSRDFTAIDIEATGKTAATAEPIEIAAVRVREGRVVEEFCELIRPPIPIPASSIAVHGITNEEVATARTFSEVWPDFQAFCRRDFVVAHNGYGFDFRVLMRLTKSAGLDYGLSGFDSLPLAKDLFPSVSHKLPDLAQMMGVEAGGHRALADTRCLVNVFLRMNDTKLSLARKTACQKLLEYLGIALALSNENELCEEALLFRQMCVWFVLGRYNRSLDHYDRLRGDNSSVPGVEDIIEALGGRKRMATIRAEKTAEDRYPAALRRLELLIDDIQDSIPFRDQMTVLLERIALSKNEGAETTSDRVNVLTIHATKGLEFSRVYIIGTEGAEFPGGTPEKPCSKEEVEEKRRLLYVGMTRTRHRLVMTSVRSRNGKLGGGHPFLDEMGIVPVEG